MNAAIAEVMGRLLEQRPVSAAQMQAATAELMTGSATPVETAALLTALAVRGEQVETLTGAARVMREHVTRIPTERTGLLDTCGTGGDALHTFNISTATAIVAAACGVPVAKHGNRSVSSSSGAADVLEALGVCIDLTPAQVARCVDELGIGFCYARLLHSAMKHVAPVRKELGFRTIFNLLGPLTNPAGAEHQLLGTGRVETAERIAGTIAQLGTRGTLVVCGNDQLDEVALWGETVWFHVRDEKITTGRWTAADFGLPECNAADLRVESPQQSAAIIREVFTGQPGAASDMVTANSAAALLAAGHCETLDTAVEQVRGVIDAGAVNRKLEQLVEMSNQLADS